MAAKKKDSRERSLFRRITEREYGGKNGHRSPQQQDTGRAFGRGKPSKYRAPRGFSAESR